MKIVPIAIMAASISGCVFFTGSSSGVLPYKNGSLTVATVHPIPSSAQKLAYDEAIKFCKKTNETIDVLEIIGERTERITLYFKCK